MPAPAELSISAMIHKATWRGFALKFSDTNFVARIFLTALSACCQQLFEITYPAFRGKMPRRAHRRFVPAPEWLAYEQPASDESAPCESGSESLHLSGAGRSRRLPAFEFPCRDLNRAR